MKQDMPIFAVHLMGENNILAGRCFFSVNSVANAFQGLRCL